MISTYLKKISIINYKNLIDKEYNLDPKINCFDSNLMTELAVRFLVPRLEDYISCVHKHSINIDPKT